LEAARHERYAQEEEEREERERQSINYFSLLSVDSGLRLPE
jgi:hypothetical protein